RSDLLVAFFQICLTNYLQLVYGNMLYSKPVCDLRVQILRNSNIDYRFTGSISMVEVTVYSRSTNMSFSTCTGNDYIKPVCVFRKICQRESFSFQFTCQCLCFGKRTVEHHKVRKAMLLQKAAHIRVGCSGSDDQKTGSKRNIHLF